ncbi:MAG: hypothetical protein ACRYFU_20620 [Janthinobacterium lividum]
MTKPQEYRQQRIVSHETQYRADEHLPHGPQAASGVLATGRVVWVRDGAKLPPESVVSAYAEGIGIVALDSQSLMA